MARGCYETLIVAMGCERDLRHSNCAADPRLKYDRL